MSDVVLTEIKNRITNRKNNGGIMRRGMKRIIRRGIVGRLLK